MRARACALFLFDIGSIQSIVSKINYDSISIMTLKTSRQLTILIFCFCTISTTVSAAEKILQSLSNLEEYQTHEGNTFKLIKIEQGCRIEAHFFLSFEQKIYNYYFNTQTLYKATEKTLRYEYKKDLEGSLDAVTKIHPYSSAIYPLTDVEMRQDFNEYKALFPKAQLKKCT
ncbi:hypothetical protein [Acinetobacter sp. WCHAc010052]|uniref:hypothetical protein n=1 Tax=Acinetobacter sp. WCHAc010052 TaxID=2004647 RepID=UPI000B3CBB04|nr:hypothetical protein [Acinetobacter sp. WCHAc010052]AXY61272.1 hypothetical protein CDG61_15405 [Acinetobacter sp. WCHAc010052]